MEPSTSVVLAQCTQIPDDVGHCETRQLWQLLEETWYMDTSGLTEACPKCSLQDWHTLLAAHDLCFCFSPQFHVPTLDGQIGT